MSNITKILLISIISLSTLSCSPYNKLIKSNDHEKMYKSALEYYKQKKNDKALYLFTTVAPYFSGSNRDDTITFYTAVTNFRLGDFTSSGEQFNDFKRKFNRSSFIEEAEYLIAMGYYYQSPVPERDQTPSQMAIAAFREYLERYPNSIKKEICNEYIVELTQKLYDKALLNAKVYYNIDYYKSAIHTLRITLSDYPETTYREEMLYLITKSSYLLANNSIESLKRGRYLDMIDSYYNLISEFPQTKYLKETTKMYDQVQKIIKKKESTENNNTIDENGSKKE